MRSIQHGYLFRSRQIEHFIIVLLNPRSGPKSGESVPIRSESILQSGQLAANRIDRSVAPSPSLGNLRVSHSDRRTLSRGETAAPDLFDPVTYRSRRLWTEPNRGRRTDRDQRRAVSDHSFLRVTREVLVDIGRDGSLLLGNGRHRLAIAKLLEVDAIPVGVLVRHADWIVHRDAVADGERVPDDPEHPDLADLEGLQGGSLERGRSRETIP